MKMKNQVRLQTQGQLVQRGVGKMYANQKYSGFLQAGKTIYNEEGEGTSGFEFLQFLSCTIILSCFLK